MEASACKSSLLHMSIKRRSARRKIIMDKIQNISKSVQRQGVYPSTAMERAGFNYKGENDTVVCDNCQLEVSEWTLQMEPFKIHAERSPDCPFVLSRLNKCSLQTTNEGNAPKRQKTESNSEQRGQCYRLQEVDKLREARRETFSHWPSHSKLFVERLIAAGFFGCNVGDRVMCLHCLIICHQWKEDEDSPEEVHKIISPECPYVISMLTHPQPLLNTRPSNDTLTNIQPRFDPTVCISPCHPSYDDLEKRVESFRRCSQEISSHAEALAQAGFFYSESSDIVVCFNCNGSLINYNEKVDPLTEHVRCYPLCSYAKITCGEDRHLEILHNNPMNNTRDEIQPTLDASRISRLVAARLDLSWSQYLLDQNFKLSIIRRCWEDQLQLKQDDFPESVNLFIACMILLKQIDHIQGNRNNIITPTDRLQLIREGKQPPRSTTSNIIPSKTNDTAPVKSEKAPTTTPIEPIVVKPVVDKLEKRPPVNKSLVNPCLMCRQEEKQLACIPCGHLVTCTDCSQTIRTCPLCQKEITAYVRIYI
ncbi:unnamed protein product [Adineta ricciae]|uniref:RING-type domain-containing protein n=1 Tax=Adineta ricciae TaxID=249248 RepID=A0A813V465_ADIRI|nr:unnamed protein product [Adineta ricciae]